jgi:hypothetical protein
MNRNVNGTANGVSFFALLAAALLTWVGSAGGCVELPDPLGDTCASVCNKAAQCGQLGSTSAGACKASCEQAASTEQTCANLMQNQAEARFNVCLAMDCGTFDSCWRAVCGPGSIGAAGATGGGAGATGAAGSQGGAAGFTGAAGSRDAGAGTGFAGFTGFDGGLLGTAGTAGSTCDTACAKADMCCMASGQRRCNYLEQCDNARNKSQSVQACNLILELLGRQSRAPAECM